MAYEIPLTIFEVVQDISANKYNRIGLFGIIVASNAIRAELQKACW